MVRRDTDSLRVARQGAGEAGKDPAEIKPVTGTDHGNLRQVHLQDHDLSARDDTRAISRRAPSRSGMFRIRRPPRRRRRTRRRRQRQGVSLKQPDPPGPAYLVPGALDHPGDKNRFPPPRSPGDAGRPRTARSAVRWPRRGTAGFAKSNPPDGEAPPGHVARRLSQTVQEIIPALDITEHLPDTGKSAPGRGRQGSDALRSRDLQPHVVRPANTP